MELQKASGYLKNAFYLNSGGSREVRKFVETKLVDTAKKNPGCVIYVKPRLFKTPVIEAEYLNGNEHYLNLHRMGVTEIEAWIDWFLTRLGYDMLRLRRQITTHRPSVQGIWTPFTFRDPQFNQTEFPSTVYGAHRPKMPPATKQVLQMINQSGSSETSSLQTIQASKEGKDIDLR